MCSLLLIAQKVKHEAVLQRYCYVIAGNKFFINEAKKQTNFYNSKKIKQ